MKWWFLVRRGIMALVTILASVILSWVLLEFSPQSPATYILSRLSSIAASYTAIFSNPQLNYTKEQLAAIQAQIQHEKEQLLQYAQSLQPHGNPLIQSLTYLWNFLHGNLGNSILTGAPVTYLIASTLPWTLLIVVPSNIISFLLGIRIGEKIGYRRGTRIDSVLSMFFTILRAVPIYVLGALILFFLGFQLHAFPSIGNYSPNLTPSFSLSFITSVLYHAVLPILTLTLTNLAGWVLGMRATTIYTLGEDYVTFAEIRGIPNNRIESRYVGRNAILPQYTGLIIALGFSFSGAIFIEQTFTYPGIGSLLQNAVFNNDYPVEMGVLIIIILAVVLGVFLADVTYSLLDPRVRQE